MSPATYQDLIRELFPRLTGGIRWGLERTERLLASVGDPHRAFRTIHVGGTNGKGSVSATIAAVLRRCDGGPIGLYTSPHLCTFRERIQIEGEPVSEAALLSAATRLWPAVEAERPSFFEATTALAFLVLAEAGVSAAVVEVGLGGRLDATNVIAPAVVALTNVAMDHAQYLGETPLAVAGEKAGIIKPGVPVVTAEPPGPVRALFQARAAQLGAPFEAVERESLREVVVTEQGTRFQVETSAWGPLSLATPLAGEHQAMNAALAVRALERLPEPLRPRRDAVLAGVPDVYWPGRLQVEIIEGRHWVFDVAHNTAGVQALVSTLDALAPPRPLVLVVGILGDKEWGSMLPPLFAAADHVVLTDPPSAPAERRWDAAAALAAVAAPAAEVVPDFASALARARGRAGTGSVLVTGSFHTVGDALALLGRAPYGSDLPLLRPASGA